MAHGKIDKDYVEDYLSSKLILPIRVSFDSSDFILICMALVINVGIRTSITCACMLNW